MKSVIILGGLTLTLLVIREPMTDPRPAEVAFVQLSGIDCFTSRARTEVRPIFVPPAIDARTQQAVTKARQRLEDLGPERIAAQACEIAVNGERLGQGQLLEAQAVVVRTLQPGNAPPHHAWGVTNLLAHDGQPVSGMRISGSRMIEDLQ